MKTLDQILQEQYQQDAIERGDIDKEDYLELDPDNVKSIKKALYKWLTEVSQAYDQYIKTKGMKSFGRGLDELLNEIQNNPKEGQKE